MNIKQYVMIVFLVLPTLSCLAQNSKVQKLSESNIPDFVSRECKIYKDSLGINNKQENEIKSLLTAFAITSINKADSSNLRTRKLKIANLLTQRDSAFKQILTEKQYLHYREMARRLAENAEKRRVTKKN